MIPHFLPSRFIWFEERVAPPQPGNCDRRRPANRPPAQNQAEDGKKPYCSMNYPTIRFFPVGNGDMTLVVFESGRKLLIDMNIRTAADDPDDDTPDVAEELRGYLPATTQTGSMSMPSCSATPTKITAAASSGISTWASRRIGRKRRTKSSFARSGLRRWCSAGLHQSHAL